MAKDDQHAGSSSAADEKRWSSLNNILVYKRMNDSMSWTGEELRKIAVKTQDKLTAMTRSLDKAKYEIHRLRKTPHRHQSTMETQRIDIITYRGNFGGLEYMYDDIRAQLEEANSGEPRNPEQRGLGSYQQAGWSDR